MHPCFQTIKYFWLFFLSVPVGDPIREITEYMDPSRDDIWEKVPSSKQVTFLVYREGDQLNFFRIIDKGDGTLTPLSESLRYTGFYFFSEKLKNV